MPEEQGVYRVVGGRRYRFPNEERAKAFDSARESLMRQYASEEGFLSQAGTALKSVLPGVVRGTGLAATGIGSILESEAAKEAGRYLEEKAKQTSELFMEPYQRYTTGAMLGETLGAMAPAALATAAAAAAIPETGGLSATVIPGIAGGVIGMLQGAGEVGEDIQQARERGTQVSPEQEQKLALTQGLITGALEGLPLGRLAKGARSLATTGRIAMSKPAEEATKEVVDLLMAGRGEIGRRALKSAGIEGLTEGAQQLSQNLLAAGAIPGIGPGYDPTRGAFEGVLESAAVGSVFGGTLQGGIDLYNKKKLEGYLSKEREKQKESAEVGRQLEDAFISREIEGQRQAEVAQGILAEEAQKAAQEAAKQEGIKLDTSLTKALGVFSKEKATPEDKLDAYREFAAQDMFEKTYGELKGAEIIQANKKAYGFFKDSVNPESLALGIQMKEREAPGAVEMVRTEAPEGMGGVLPSVEVAPTPTGEERIPAFQDRISRRLFGKPYSRLEPEQITAVDTQVEREVGRPIIAPRIEEQQRQAEQKAIQEQQESEARRQKQDAALSSALEIASREGATVSEKRAAYKDIIAISELGSTYGDLRGKDIRSVNARVQGIIKNKQGVEDLDAVKEFRARQAATEPVAEAPAAPEVEIATAPEVPQPTAPVEQVPEITEPVADRETGVVSRPEDWDSMLPSQQLNWAKRAYPYAPQSEIESFVTNTDPRLGAEVLGYADRRIAKKNEEFRVKFPPATEEGMAKLPKGKRPVSPVEAAAVQPERGTPIERAPRRLQPEPGLKLDVEAARGVSEKAYEQLKKLNVSDIYSTVVVDNFLDEKGEVKPDMAQFLNNVIKIASKQNDVATSEKNLIDTVNHEVVHGMRKSGFFTDAEWNLLTSKFNPNEELDKDTIAAYQERFKAQGPEAVQEKLQEEAVAHAIERLSDAPARELDIPSVSMLTKVKSLARLGTAANNLGYNAEDLISAVRAGQVGRRAIKGVPTVLEAVKAGRMPAQPVPEAGIRELEEAVEAAATPTQEEEVAPELRGSIVEEPSAEPKTVEEREDASMYKLPPQEKPSFFKVKEQKDLVQSFKNSQNLGEFVGDVTEDIRGSRLVRDVAGERSDLGTVRLGLRQRILDSAASIAKNAENLFRQKGDTKYTDTATSAISAYRQSQKSNELLSEAFNKGYIYFDKALGWFMVKESKDHAIMPQLKKLAAKGKLYKAWDAAIAQRYVDVHDSGLDAKKMLGGKFDLKAAQDTVNKYKTDQDIQEFLRVYRNFNNAMIDLNRYVGNYDQATAAKLKAWYYSPYYRVPLDENGYLEAPKVAAARITNLQSAKRISGRELEINDAIENFITNAQYMVGYATKNEAARRAVRDAVDAKLAVRVASPKQAGKRDRVVRINENGSKAYYEILDPLLYQAMNTAQARLDSMVALGRGFSNLLRSGVTKSPTFMFNNVFLDSFRLWSLGIYKDNIVKSTIGNIAQGIRSVRNQDEVYQKLLRAGLITNNMSARDAVQAAKEIRRQLAIEQSNAISSMLRKLKDYTLGGLEELSRKSEAVNRVQVYKNVLRDMQAAGSTKEVAESAALFAAMEYPVNFDVKGSGQIVQYATALLPFVNATAQGTDVFYRNIKEMWKTSATRERITGEKIAPINKLQASSLEAAKRTLLSSMVLGTLYSFAMAASDNDDYRKLSLEERMQNILVPVPGAGTVKIPVPPELGAMTLMVPAAFAEYIYGTDNGPQIVKSMAAFFSGLFTFDPTPQVIRPIAEVITNKNFYTFRPIENQSMQRILPEYRYEETTSELSKKLGEFASKAKMPISPLQFEHLIRGYFGTLGMFTADLTNQLFDTQNNDIDRLKLSDPYLLPGVGRKFVAPTDRKALEDYYEIRNAATQAANTLKMVEASKVFEDNPEKLREMAFMAQVNQALEAGPEKQMQELRKLKQQVMSAPNTQIGASRKTEVLKQINLRINEIARGVQPLKRHIPFTLF